MGTSSTVLGRNLRGAFTFRVGDDDAASGDVVAGVFITLAIIFFMVIVFACYKRYRRLHPSEDGDVDESCDCRARVRTGAVSALLSFLSLFRDPKASPSHMQVDSAFDPSLPGQSPIAECDVHSPSSSHHKAAGAHSEGSQHTQHVDTFPAVESHSKHERHARGHHGHPHHHVPDAHSHSSSGRGGVLHRPPSASDARHAAPQQAWSDTVRASASVSENEHSRPSTANEHSRPSTATVTPRRGSRVEDVTGIAERHDVNVGRGRRGSAEHGRRSPTAQQGDRRSPSAAMATGSAWATMPGMVM